MYLFLARLIFFFRDFLRVQYLYVLEHLKFKKKNVCIVHVSLIAIVLQSKRINHSNLIRMKFILYEFRLLFDERRNLYFRPRTYVFMFKAVAIVLRLIVG